MAYKAFHCSLMQYSVKRLNEYTSIIFEMALLPCFNALWNVWSSFLHLCEHQISGQIGQSKPRRISSPALDADLPCFPQCASLSAHNKRVMAKQRHQEKRLLFPNNSPFHDRSFGE